MDRVVHLIGLPPPIQFLLKRLFKKHVSCDDILLPPHTKSPLYSGIFYTAPIGYFAKAANIFNHLSYHHRRKFNAAFIKHTIPNINLPNASPVPNMDFTL